MNSLPSLGIGQPVFSFDVGGTDIKAGLIDASGLVAGFRRSPTPLAGKDTPAHITNRLATLGDELRQAHPGAEPESAGVLVPGIVDPERGTGVYSSNLGWRNAPIRDLAEAALGIPVAFHHDIHAASMAEYRLGVARDFRDVVVMVIGTGIAGTVIINGRAHLAGGYAGEFGHSPVAEGPECACGARGCLEAVASAAAIGRRYRELSSERDKPPVTGSPAAAPRASEVLERLRHGDPVAAEVWNSAVDAIAFALAQATAVIAPEAFVIAGGLSRAGDELFVPLRERLNARLSFHRRPHVLQATLGDEAGLLGAALFARELVERPESAR